MKKLETPLNEFRIKFLVNGFGSTEVVNLFSLNAVLPLTIRKLLCVYFYSTKINIFSRLVSQKRRTFYVFSTYLQIL